MNTLSTYKRIRNLVQRITFHNRFPSRVVAEIMYLVTARGDERKSGILETLDTFHTDEYDANWRGSKKQIKDLLYTRAFFAATYKEYFLYGLNESKSDEKLNYVCWFEMDYYYSLLDQLGRPEIFDQKDKTYEAFKAFYRREQIFIRALEDKQMFVSFLDRHPSCILKPPNELGGHGIRFVHVTEETTSDEAWNQVKDRCPFVLEEMIVQAPEMNAFYPYSVNTIRYNTFYHEGKLTRLQAVFRIGRGGSIVDNATSGGIYSLVDTETGRILCPARSYLKERFERHPDTGILLEGNFIPRWDELNDLLEKVVRVVPEQKQVGWDFALSKDGWVMVEGNTNPELQGFDLDHGLRDKVTAAYGEAIPVWR